MAVLGLILAGEFLLGADFRSLYVESLSRSEPLLRKRLVTCKRLKTRIHQELYLVFRGVTHGSLSDLGWIGVGRIWRKVTTRSTRGEY